MLEQTKKSGWGYDVFPAEDYKKNLYKLYKHFGRVNDVIYKTRDRGRGKEDHVLIVKFESGKCLQKEKMFGVNTIILRNENGERLYTSKSLEGKIPAEDILEIK